MPSSPPTPDQSELKTSVREFWDVASCGEVYAVGDSERERLDAQAKVRYELEPYIDDFARFAEGAGRDVLEVGVGMGADHQRWAQSRPRSLTGIDLTPRAIAFTGARLAANGLASALRVGDAENLPFADASFDIVYSWGVLHHTPQTPRAIAEVHRVLRPGGVARIMIYHTHSLVGYMLWLRYALLAGRPARSLADIYAHHLESPGTKAYTADEARAMCRAFRRVEIRIELSPGDVLDGAAGQRHRGALLRAARAIWPRGLVRRWLSGRGLFMLIEATK